MNDFLFALVIPLIGVYLGFILTLRKSNKQKYIVWGLLTAFLFAPFLGWSISLTISDGFGALGIALILFPGIFLLGIILLLIGIFKKKV